MRKIMICTFVLVMMLLFSSCGDKSTDIRKESGGVAKEVSSNNNETTTDVGSSSSTAKSDELILPDSYPTEILPLAADAEIIDVRENPANSCLEIMYVSDNDIGTLRDFYEGVLKDAKDLSTDETSEGYMISAETDGVGYTISLSKDAMNSIPKYAGKISVYLILTGLEGISDSPQMPIGEGDEWPSEDLQGVPQLKGHINQILREDDIIRLEITVENAETVKSYIGELTTADFSFDTEPDLESNHMEFLAFRGSSMMSFALKGDENLVSIEYQK